MIKFYEIMRIIFFPIFRFVLPIFVADAKKRIEFEQNNMIELNRLSRAEFGFEISSEGEYEQVIFLIKDLLKNEKNVEIIYCSQSVEHKVKKLSHEFPEQVRSLRMPLLTYKPWLIRQNAYKWLTCHTLFMCRYDFFPELIFYGSRNDKNFYLLSGAVKNFNQKNYIAKSYLQWCYSKFDRVLAATELERNRFCEFGLVEEEKVLTGDLRSLQIQARVLNHEQTIQEKFPIFTSFCEKVIKKADRSLIFGSFWDYEASIFKGVHPDDLFKTTFCLAPHKLGKQNILNLIEKISHYQLAVYIINQETTEKQLDILITEYLENPGVWLFDVKGVLCEMYTAFDMAYVGGGFGESIHSVLEPFLSGCHVICGPNTARSSEFDFILDESPDKISVVNKKSEVLQVNKKSGLNLNKSNHHIKTNFGDIKNFFNIEYSKDE